MKTLRDPNGPGKEAPVPDKAVAPLTVAAVHVQYLDEEGFMVHDDTHRLMFVRHLEPGDKLEVTLTLHT